MEDVTEALRLLAERERELNEELRDIHIAKRALGRLSERGNIERPKPKLELKPKMLLMMVSILLEYQKRGVSKLAMAKLYEEMLAHGYVFPSDNRAKNINNLSMTIYRNGGNHVVRDKDKNIVLGAKYGELEEKWGKLI